MKVPSLCHGALPALVVFAFVSLAPRANAQNTSDDQPLLEIIKQQQKQLAAQQAQLEALSDLLKELQEQLQSLEMKTDKHEQIVDAVQPPTDPNVAQEIRRPSDSSPATSTTRQDQVLDPADLSYSPASSVTGRLSERSRFDRTAPSGANVSDTPAAVVLRDPKTGTEVGIHGFAQFQVIHDTVGLDNNEFDTIGIPVDGAPSQTKFSVNPSRIGIDSATPLGWGRLNTLVSLDLNGSLNEPEWRLRQAYGEIINDEKDFAFLFGQTFSTPLDLKSVPETMDFAGPTGYFARRHPLIRFSRLFHHKVMFNLAVETPESTVYIDADARTRWPDLVGALSWDIDGDYLSHLRVVGLVRDLQATDTATGAQDGSVGWAVGASGKVNLPFLLDRDNFKFGVQYGDGYGGLIKSGPADAVFNPSSGSLETIGVFSTYGGIQHWWADKWRSNVVGGYVNASNPGFIDPERLENTTYFATNLVWVPLGHATFGIEYLYGRRENVDGNSGTTNRFLFSSKFDF